MKYCLNITRQYFLNCKKKKGGDMGFLDISQEDRSKIEYIKLKENLKNIKHTLHCSSDEYILINDITGEKYKYNKLTSFVTLDDIVKQAIKNSESNSKIFIQKRISKEWLHEPNYHKRRKLLSKRYIKENLLNERSIKS